MPPKPLVIDEEMEYFDDERKESKMVNMSNKDEPLSQTQKNLLLYSPEDEEELEQEIFRNQYDSGF